MSSNAITHPEEFKYFKKWARRFDDEPPERRYGIPKEGATKVEDMLYESDPGKLFMKFITEGTIGAQVHDSVLKIEVMEGKKHKSILERRRY